MPDEPADDPSDDAGRAVDGGGLGRSAARDVLPNAALEVMAEHLRCDARSWAAQVRTMEELASLMELGAKAGVPQFGQLEMAGSWSVSQLTASRWQEEAERFTTALPMTLALLETGSCCGIRPWCCCTGPGAARSRWPGRSRRRCCPPPPAAAGWCPADLGRRIDRVLLRIESEQADAAAERRTFTRPEPDGMGLAGAVLTAEQLVGWSAGMDTLERRERPADRQAGVDRTADQRRADLFAARPEMLEPTTRAPPLAGRATGRGRWVRS